MSTGAVALPGWLAHITLGQVVALLFALAMLAGACRWLSRTLRPYRQFAADWSGEPERPGVPARPGVMERLEAIEAKLPELAATADRTHRSVQALTEQFANNGGSSLRDAIDRIERRLDEQPPVAPVKATVSLSTPDRGKQ